MSVDETKATNASSYHKLVEHKHNKNNMSLNADVDLDKHVTISSKLLLNAAEKRKAVHNLQEKARNYNST